MEHLYNILTLPKDETIPHLTQVHSSNEDMEIMLHNYLNLSKTTGAIISCSKTSGTTTNINHSTCPTPQLICFDMDSTLIKIEIIDELADYMGIGAQMRKITAETMYGKLNFRESFLQRVMLLKGLDIKVLNTLAETMPMAEGLQELITNLKNSKIKTAIITGNFSCFGNFLKKKYGFDYIFTTEVETTQHNTTGAETIKTVAEVNRDITLSGNIKGEIIDALCKSRILLKLCKQENITPAQCIAVGDGANDLPMLTTAGTGIIYNAASCGNITRILRMIS